LHGRQTRVIESPGSDTSWSSTPSSSFKAALSPTVADTGA